MPIMRMVPVEIVVMPGIGQIIPPPGGSGSAIGLAERVAGRGTVRAVVALALGETGCGGAQEHRQRQSENLVCHSDVFRSCILTKKRLIGRLVADFLRNIGS